LLLIYAIGKSDSKNLDQIDEKSAFNVISLSSNSSNYKQEEQENRRNNAQQQLDKNGFNHQPTLRKRRRRRTSEEMFRHSNKDMHRLVPSGEYDNAKMITELFHELDTIENEDEVTEKSSSSKILDCVIIGGGWAGIAAAMRLKAGGKNIQILEARNHIGGRSHTKKITVNEHIYPIDMGSQWIHGVDDNPITVIAQQHNLPLVLENDEDADMLVFEENGGGPVEENEAYFDALFDEFYTYQEESQCSTEEDKPLSDVADKYQKENGMNDNNKEDRYFNFIMNNMIEQSYGEGLGELSSWWWNSDSGFPGSEGLPINGYEPIIDAYAKPLESQIMLNARVSYIDYQNTNSAITVEYELRDERGELKDVETVRTKNVIVTVPLGVLKRTDEEASSIEFQPSLPEEKKVAISQLGMGLLNKVIMFWKEEDVFWSKDIEWYGDVAGTNEQSYKFEFYTPFSMNGGRPFLVGFLTGDDAWRLEEKYGFSGDDEDEMYKKEITAEAMKSLRNMFGAETPSPDMVVATRWGTDPYSFGSYSFNKVGMNENARSILAKPILLNDSSGLYFAGEATSSAYFGTTHGAFISGRTAAEEVLMSTDDDPPSETSSPVESPNVDDDDEANVDEDGDDDEANVDDDDGANVDDDEDEASVDEDDVEASVDGDDDEASVDEDDDEASVDDDDDEASVDDDDDEASVDDDDDEASVDDDDSFWK